MTLCVEDIHFSYNGHPVLTDAGFSLETGEVMCVLGVNGAGKSTLLKCLNRILSPSRGTVLVRGEDVLQMAQNEVARRIGHVPQSNPETRLSVFETVLLGRRPHIRWSLAAEDYALAEKIILQMGLAHLAMRPLCDLSGGEAQKVAIARALAQTPEVLLLDEPTSSLDLKNQLEVMELVRDIVKNQGLSALVAIHDLNIALRFSDRLLFLKDGRIRSISTIEELTPEMIQEIYGVPVSLASVEGRTVVVPV